MTTANVSVTRISNKTVTTKFGPKPAFSFQADDGQWYSTGFKKPRFVVGDSISFDFETNTYGNQVDDASVVVTTAKKGLSTMPSTAPSKPATPTGGGYQARVFPVPPLSGERAIIRQNALTNAREVFVAAHGGKPFAMDKLSDTADAIIALARLFENYTTGDADTEMAHAMMKEAEEMKEAA